MIDALASEYGWSTEYIMGLPCDVSAMLVHAILYRKGIKTLRRSHERDESAGDLQSRLDGIFGKIDNNK